MRNLQNTMKTQKIDFNEINSTDLILMKNYINKELRKREYEENKHFYLSLIRSNDVVILPSSFNELKNTKDITCKKIFVKILIHSKSECESTEILLDREINRELIIYKDLLNFIIPPITMLNINYENGKFKKVNKCKFFKNCKLHWSNLVPLYLYGKDLKILNFDNIKSSCFEFELNI